MNKENWDSEYEDYQDPWDHGIYQTGSTKPPKNHGGLIALLLVLVIFLGGISSALGILNIRLFRQIAAQQEKTEEAPVSFSDELSTEPSLAMETMPTFQEQQPSGDVHLELYQSPDSIPNIPQEGGLSLQEIYALNIDSTVSVLCNTGTGTGVVLSSDGYIVTNCHVIEDASAIEVRFTDQRILPATLIGADTISDLAVLRVDAQDLTPAQFGDSSVLQVGDTVVAIGDPLGAELRGSMTDGIVSAINREVTLSGRSMTLIQTNAALNAGNSGGPLINCYGQVIGINTMKIGDYMSAAGVEGLGFAIPSTTVKEIVDQLVSQGYVSGRPTLGITCEAVSSFYQLYYRLPQGLFITAVEENSAADLSGLETGDILLQANGHRITDIDELNTLIYAAQVGDTMDLVIYRSGRQYALTLTLEERKG